MCPGGHCTGRLFPVRLFAEFRPKIRPKLVKNGRLGRSISLPRIRRIHIVIHTFVTGRAVHAFREIASLADLWGTHPARARGQARARACAGRQAGSRACADGTRSTTGVRGVRAPAAACHTRGAQACPAPRAGAAPRAQSPHARKCAQAHASGRGARARAQPARRAGWVEGGGIEGTSAAPCHALAL